MLKRYLVLRLAVALVVLPMLAVLAGCSKENPVSPVITAEQTATPADTTQTGRIDKPGVGPSRLHPDNRIAIQYECYYALRQSWGYISWQSATSTAQRSNWAYLLSDPNAHSKAVEWYGADASMWKGWPSYYSNMDVYSWTALNRYGQNTGTVRSHGGQCRSFAALILYRAGVRTTKLPTYGASARPYYQIRIGDVIETNTVNGHTAVVVGIVEGAAGSSVRKVVVVDSNWIGDEEIGMHVIAVTSGPGVGNLANYRALNLGY